MDSLPYYNNTNYPLALKNKLDTLKPNNNKLRKSQFIPLEFYTQTNSRGLLLAHAMGQGKTRLAVAIAHEVHKKEPSRQILVLLPKSLEGNFRENISAYVDDDNTDYFKYISLNASNMYKQMESVHKSESERKYEKRLGSFLDDILRENSLNDSLLIIDEAHNLFNAITNGSKNATKLYDLIMTASNLKLIFLTGTPVVNDPFELVPCFNMLRGRMKSHLTFTESYHDFKDFFVDEKNNKIKNKDKFMNRIYGLTSYYGDLYFSQKVQREGFPKKLPTIIEKIPMSQRQFGVYSTARNSELEETSKGYRSNQARFSASSGGSSTYRVKTRQISNFAMPNYALGPTRGKKSRKKFVERLKNKDLTSNLHDWSPKMEKMLHNILGRKNQPGMVYSQFVSGEGLAVFAKVLESSGYNNYLDDNITSGGDEYGIVLDGGKVKAKQPTYAILSGQIPPEKRIEIIRTFNDKSNHTGEVIHLLLMSSAVAEGIDLKRIRHVHIMEPFWNYARINQVETRAIRYGSHTDLPKKEQNVQVYIYLSTYPTGHPKKKQVELTTDVDLFKKSVEHMQLINEFLLAIAESSMDCNIHHRDLPSDVKKRVKCKLCSPTNQPMFHPSINQDMAEESRCHEYKEIKLKVHKITIPDIDIDYYYKKDGDHIELYSFNEKLQGFTPMPRDNPHYGVLMERLI